MPNRRPYDLILMGATGFTGRLVAEHLLRTYGVEQGLRWAIAGRNKKKMARIRAELGDERLHMLYADSLDPASLHELAPQATVLCSTVGPYARFGSETVAACVQHGTHYCDLTGEVQWMRRMIDAHHQTAAARQLRIVPSCGVDSIPSDLGVFWLQEQARQLTGTYCHHIKTGVKGFRGGFSGGTVASLLNVLDEASADRKTRRLLANPYALDPDPDHQGPDGPDRRRIQYDTDFESWTAPFVMATINTRVVRRSHALLGRPYGDDFRYDEYMLSGEGLRGRLQGYGMALPLALLSGAKPGSLSRKLLDRLAPDPGEGPSPEARAKGFWVFDLIGILPDGERIKARLNGKGDPGYASTSRMLAEAAVCLAKDDLPEHYGVITPSTAMGDSLVVRLEARADVRFRLTATPDKRSHRASPA